MYLVEYCSANAEANAEAIDSNPIENTKLRSYLYRPLDTYVSVSVVHIVFILILTFFQMRILDRVSTQLTTLHKVLLDDLFKLATTVYTEVGLWFPVVLLRLPLRLYVSILKVKLSVSLK